MDREQLVPNWESINKNDTELSRATHQLNEAFIELYLLKDELLATPDGGLLESIARDKYIAQKQIVEGLWKRWRKAKGIS